MLQQTQTGRVTDFYRRWLRKYPDFRQLARAPKADVLRQWSGLGYNNRALRLHSIAQTVTTRYRGQLPSDIQHLRSLPGIGKYTAHAVACFAFLQNVAVVDVNVQRILSRLVRRDRLLTKREAWQIAEKLLPPTKAYAWNQALMDLGGKICTARHPRCGECPLRKRCRSAFSMTGKETRQKKPEPAFHGVPRRIYRGRILKVLHGRTLTPFAIGKLIKGDFQRRELPWIEEVLSHMHRDGLIQFRKNGGEQKVRIAS